MDGNVQVPYPWQLRGVVKEAAIEELKLRDFMVKEETPEAKLDALARWALSYKEADDLQKPMLDEIHECARKYLALVKVQKEADILKSDIGKALRLLGVACQQIKVDIFSENIFSGEKVSKVFICVGCA